MRTLFIGCAVLVAGTASATNLLSNGSFESGEFVANGDNTMVLGTSSTTMTGWTVTTSQLAWIQDPNPFNGIVATDGIKSLDLTSYSNTSPYAGVQQSFSTINGATYSLTFDIGANQSYGDASLNWSAGANSGFASVFGAVGQKWITIGTGFTANSATTTLNLVGSDALGATNYVGLDNVRVELLATPEPATMAFLAFGGLALIKRRRN